MKRVITWLAVSVFVASLVVEHDGGLTIAATVLLSVAFIAALLKARATHAHLCSRPR